MSLPKHLGAEAGQGLVAGEPVAQFEIGDHRNFVYLIVDWETKTAAVVDPQRDLAPLDEALGAHGLALSGILLTHTHHDHVAGVPGLIARDPAIPVYVNRHDVRRLHGLAKTHLREIRDGDTIPVGNLRIEVLHTPGHSAGECSYLLHTPLPYLFTGDTIFIRDCGRTDLDSGSNEQMFESIQRVKKLDPRTVILPGHHYRKECASTLERELRESPPFLCKSVEELASLP